MHYQLHDYKKRILWIRCNNKIIKEVKSFDRMDWVQWVYLAIKSLMKRMLQDMEVSWRKNSTMECQWEKLSHISIDVWNKNQKTHTPMLKYLDFYGMDVNITKLSRQRKMKRRNKKQPNRLQCKYLFNSSSWEIKEKLSELKWSGLINSKLNWKISKWTKPWFDIENKIHDKI